MEDSDASKGREQRNAECRCADIALPPCIKNTELIEAYGLRRPLSNMSSQISHYDLEHA